jgi:hypothetical protein
MSWPSRQSAAMGHALPLSVICGLGLCGVGACNRSTPCDDCEGPVASVADASSTLGSEDGSAGNAKFLDAAVHDAGVSPAPAVDDATMIGAEGSDAAADGGADRFGQVPQAGAQPTTDSGVGVVVAHEAGAGRPTQMDAAGPNGTGEGTTPPAAADAGGQFLDAGVGMPFTVTANLASDEGPTGLGTVGVVRWSIDVPSLQEAHIDFGLDTGYGYRAPVDLSQEGYRTLLLGMKPDQTYHFRIVADDGRSLHISDDFTLDSGPSDETFLHPTTQVDSEGRERGFIVTSYYRGVDGDTAFILDADGEVVWWRRPNVAGGVARAQMSADGQSLWLVSINNSGAPLVRVTMDGLTQQVYESTLGSHDITAVSGELMAYLDYGEADCDSVVEIDNAGNVQEVFELSDYLTRDGSLDCHGNALHYSRWANAYTISSLKEDVFILYRDSGEVWRLSEHVEGGNLAWGGAQHGHQLLEGSLLIFGNEGPTGTGFGTGNTSSVIEYSLTSPSDESWRYDGELYTRNLGDVQRLPGGNTLVTFSNEGVIQEIDAAGQPVYQLNADPMSFGYAQWGTSLYASQESNRNTSP